MKPATVCVECKRLNCVLHSARKRYDEQRGDSTRRGYDRAWRKVRAVKVSLNPLCELCVREGKVTPAQEVHHVQPVATNPDLRLALENLVSLCAAHHRHVERHGMPGGGA